MKKWTIITSFVAVLLAIVYAFAWFFVFPKSAAVMTPLKWRAVKSGHRRSEYLYYLGDPNSDTTKWNTKGDTWISYNGNYTFEMQVNYKDSVGRVVYLRYHFKNWLFDKNDLVLSDSADDDSKMLHN